MSCLDTCHCARCVNYHCLSIESYIADEQVNHVVYQRINGLIERLLNIKEKSFTPADIYNYLSEDAEDLKLNEDLHQRYIIQHSKTVKKNIDEIMLQLNKKVVRVEAYQLFNTVVKQLIGEYQKLFDVRCKYVNQYLTELLNSNVVFDKQYVNKISTDQKTNTVVKELSHIPAYRDLRSSQHVKFAKKYQNEKRKSVYYDKEHNTISGQPIVKRDYNTIELKDPASYANMTAVFKCISVENKSVNYAFTNVFRQPLFEWFSGFRQVSDYFTIVEYSFPEEKREKKRKCLCRGICCAVSSVIALGGVALWYFVF